ncbi:hypothetical protein BKN14_03290 [Candidatus Gracilibacteria bacterium HOT-871]|nr:hypothetical protein BKN14_03290 [Candidatus Gracilibacteria bacterium HOT-871]
MSMRLKKKDFYSILFFGLLFGYTFYLSGISTVLESILGLIILLIAFYVIYFLIKKIFRSKNITGFGPFSSIYCFCVSIIFSICIAIVGGFSYYYNEISPAYMPQYTLTNGDKTVVFQSMAHIGGKGFYNYVAEDLKKHKDEGYLHFFEGVRPGTKENMEEFNKALGMNFDKDIYTNMSKLYGVTFQDYNAIIGSQIINPTSDVNIDISVDDIMNEYKKLKTPATTEGDILDYGETMKNLVDRLNQRELNLVTYINRAVLNLLLGNRDIMMKMGKIGNDEIWQVIIGKRNEVVANAIINGKTVKKYYVTYGLLHFDGIFELLKKNDPNWKITKTTYHKLIED